MLLYARWIKNCHYATWGNKTSASINYSEDDGPGDIFTDFPTEQNKLSVFKITENEYKEKALLIATAFALRKNAPDDSAVILFSHDLIKDLKLVALDQPENETFSKKVNGMHINIINYTANKLHSMVNFLYWKNNSDFIIKFYSEEINEYAQKLFSDGDLIIENLKNNKNYYKPEKWGFPR